MSEGEGTPRQRCSLNKAEMAIADWLLLYGSRIGEVMVSFDPKGSTIL